jgi:hypothetical protein
MATFNPGAVVDAVGQGKTTLRPILGQCRSAPLPMEQKMLWGTLNASNHPMSAIELTKHWAPTWSLEEVTKFLDDLVKTGWARVDGRQVKLYSASMASVSRKVGSK